MPTIQEIIEQIEVIDLQISEAATAVQSAEQELSNAQQKGTSNSCWSRCSRRFNRCLQKYKDKVQEKNKLQDLHQSEKALLVEQLNNMQEELRLQEEEELATTMGEDIEVEVDIDTAGNTNDYVETGYEETM